MRETKQRWFQTIAMCAAGVWAFFVFVTIDWRQARQNTETAAIELQRLRAGATASGLAVSVASLGQIGDDAKQLFHVTCDYRVTNAGDTEKEVTYAVVHAFYSPLPELVRREDGEEFALIPLPARDNANWHWLESQGCYYAEKWREDRHYRLPSGNRRIYSKGGCGTSALDAGEESKGSFDFVIRAPVKDLVGCELYLGFDGGATSANQWKYREYAFLVNSNNKSGER